MKEELIIKEIRGKRYVLKKYTENRAEFSKPDFMGTGMALVGILRNCETLDNFECRVENVRERIEKSNEKIPKSLIKKGVFSATFETVYGFVDKDFLTNNMSIANKKRACELILRIMASIQKIQE